VHFANITKVREGRKGTVLFVSGKASSLSKFTTTQKEPSPISSFQPYQSQRLFSWLTSSRLANYRGLSSSWQTAKISQKFHHLQELN
jgi:hypothetical protein